MHAFAPADPITERSLSTGDYCARCAELDAWEVELARIETLPLRDRAAARAAARDRYAAR